MLKSEKERRKYEPYHDYCRDFLVLGYGNSKRDFFDKRDQRHKPAGQNIARPSFSCWNYSRFCGNHLYHRKIPVRKGCHIVRPKPSQPVFLFARKAKRKTGCFCISAYLELKYAYVRKQEKQNRNRTL
jgi:hypothetical protein